MPCATPRTTSNPKNKSFFPGPFLFLPLPFARTRTIFTCRTTETSASEARKSGLSPRQSNDTPTRPIKTSDLGNCLKRVLGGIVRQNVRLSRWKNARPGFSSCVALFVSRFPPLRAVSKANDRPAALPKIFFPSSQTWEEANSLGNRWVLEGAG